MKKLFYLMLVTVFATFLFTGCAKKGPEPLENACLKGAPGWVIDPSMEGGLTGLGSAKIGAAGLSFARTESIANARDEMARSLSIKVKNMFKNFTQVTGVGDAQTVDKVAANVSKQVANETLEGSKPKQVWISPCNEYYVLVVMDPGLAKKSVEQSVKTSLKNEQALWQQFLAKKAQDELDAEIDKEFGK